MNTQTLETFNDEKSLKVIMSEALVICIFIDKNDRHEDKLKLMLYRFMLFFWLLIVL